MSDTQSDSVAFISHGGGPLPLLGDPAHEELVATLRHLSTVVRKPSAILVISAHWEERAATITSGRKPSLIYDYYGFPEESYEIEYPAPGAPILAKKIHAALTAHSIEARVDEGRGFDHGLFVPLKIIYPSADIPCVQLSLVAGLDPAEHIRIGNALRELPSENVLVIGSGFSFHNLRAFFTPPTEESRRMNESFEEWLIDTCANRDLGEEERIRRLESWEDAPSARYCHPREEHLMPLHVCCGLAGKAAREVFRFEVMGKRASACVW